MKFVVFGLTMSSSWGNGHATLWRALCRALYARGHRTVFFERDVPYYAQFRDEVNPHGCDLRLYASWEEARTAAARELADADVGMVTSYCPDGPAAAALVLDSAAALKLFYDMDTPVTLARVAAGEHVAYLPASGLGDFDLVLSYTGGRALPELRARLGARAVAPLYGSVDPDVHTPSEGHDRYRCALSYLGTYAADRQAAVNELFLAPAERRSNLRFTLAGSQYPADFAWRPNIFYVSHMPPAEHRAFYGSSGLTLNVTRAPMAEMGFCPSGRLFEAAACGTAILSDWWDGLDAFFVPGDEILIAATSEDALAAIDLPDAQRAAVARRGRERTLECHTAARRAAELEAIVSRALGRDAGAGVGAAQEVS